MTIIGVIGGLGPEGTIHYYRKLTQRLQALPVESRPSLSIDHLWMDSFAALLGQQAETDIVALLTQSLERLRSAGASVGLIAAVTPHKFLPSDRLPLPLADIVSATLDRVARDGYRRVGLLGTRPTLTEAFFRGRFDQAGLDVVVPPPEEIAFLHDLIFGALARGEATEQDKARVSDMAAGLAQAGAEVLIVACTDLMDLIGTDVPLLDPIDCHVELAVEMASAG